MEFGKPPTYSGATLHFDNPRKHFFDSHSGDPHWKTWGCITLAQQGELTLPFDLKPHGRYPLRVDVGTYLRVGPLTQHAGVRAQTRDGIDAASAELLIQGRVWTTLLALPENVAVDVKAAERERPITRSVILADEWHEGELALRKIESTAGERLRIEVMPASGPVIIQGLDVKNRFEPTLTYTPPDSAESFDETVTIHAADEKAPPTRIRLHGQIVPLVVMKPGRLFIANARPGVRVTRQLSAVFDRAAVKSVRCVEVPDNLKMEASVEDRRGGRSVSLSNRRRHRLHKNPRTPKIAAGVQPPRTWHNRTHPV